MLNTVLEIAGEIGHVVRRGRNTEPLSSWGTPIESSRAHAQLVINPFLGHCPEERMITSLGIGHAGGAREARRGLHHLGGRTDPHSRFYLEWAEHDVEVPPGLGARHVAAAAVTACTAATAVVSETDGYVRVFAYGKLVMQNGSRLDRPVIAGQ